MPYYRCPACGLTSYSAAAYSSISACPTCPAELTDDSKLRLVAGARHDLSFTLLARPAAAAHARRALIRVALPEVTRDDLALLVTELVTNSVVHAGLSPADCIDVELTNGTGTVRLAVHDRGPGFAPGPAEASEPLGANPLVPNGRGLVILAALSSRWGVDRDADGCTVWCEVAVKDGLAAASDDETAIGRIRELGIEMARADL